MPSRLERWLRVADFVATRGTTDSVPGDWKALAQTCGSDRMNDRWSKSLRRLQGMKPTIPPLCFFRVVVETKAAQTRRLIGIAWHGCVGAPCLERPRVP
jgi:hypothetical protein